MLFRPACWAAIIGFFQQKTNQNKNQKCMKTTNNWFIVNCLLAASVTIFTTSVLSAPVQWADNGHWYELILDTSSSWDQANAIATSSGGYLATITSSGEQTFVNSLLSASGCPSGGYWMGLKWTTPYVFGWANGENLSYTHWASNQPDNANNSWADQEDRVQILWTSDADSQRAYYNRRGTWNDIRNLGWSPNDSPMPQVYDLNRAGYIIESVPEPTTMALAGLGGLSLLLMRRRK